MIGRLLKMFLLQTCVQHTIYHDYYTICIAHNRHMAQGIATRLLVEGFLGSSLAWVRIFYRKRPTYTFLVESALRE